MNIFRYNHTTDDTLDRLPPSAVRGSLTATNVFQRFTPPVGAVYRLRSGHEFFADYSEDSRAPTRTSPANTGNTYRS